MNILLHNEEIIDLQKCGVYTITNKITGKMYLGSTTVSFGRRWRTHLLQLTNNKHHSIKLQRSFNKHGIANFLFEILDVTTKENASDIEYYWLNLLDTVIFGYNMSYSTKGGCLGCKITDLHKSKISNANKGNQNFKGSKHQEDSINQIKESLKVFYLKDTPDVNLIRENSRNRRILINKTVLQQINKKPILQLDPLTSEVIKEWDSAKDVENDLGVKATSITKVCKGRGKTANGFKWSYKN